jgi:hypothetical protein
MTERQDIVARDGSTAMQAGRDINVVNGLSYEDVRTLALDVFKANFLELAGIAQDVALARAEKLVEEYLHKLQIEHPDGIRQSNDPDFQYSLYVAQRDFARSGDSNLGDLLVSLLVDRSKQETQSLLKLVLNESITTATKLTTGQLCTLSVIFLLTHTQQLGLRTLEAFGLHLDLHIAPFIDDMETSRVSFQHLAYAACGIVQVGNTSLPLIFSKTYRGLFSRGISSESAPIAKDIADRYGKAVFRECINNPSRLQVNAVNQADLDLLCKHCKMTDSDRELISGLFQQNIMDNSDVEKKCVEIRPYMARMFEYWKDTNLKSFQLTSVGMALGHANLIRVTGKKFAELEIWVR